MCCRRHDFCPTYLEPGQCIRKFCNNGDYTISHCSCDTTF
ncbi:putative acidic phospholipase a2 pa4, partial [Temnothorax longispinosus]